MKWTTQFGDVVTVGDLVALSLTGHPDARGVIVGDAGDGRASCVLTECGRCAGYPTVEVEDFNLAMLIKRGGEKPYAR